MNRLAESELHDARARIVQLARAVIDGRLGIVAGCREITALGHEVDPDGEDAELRGIAGINSETDRFPLGDVRRHWDEAALRAKDAERAVEEEAFRPHALALCRALVERYSRPI